MDEKEYSARTIIEALNNMITKLETECNEIENLLTSDTVRDRAKKNFLYVQLGKKRQALTALIERRNRLSRIGNNISYRGRRTTGEETEGRITHIDRRVNRVNEKLTQRQAEAAALPTGSKNLYLKIAQKRAKKAVKRLEAKKGRIEKRGKRIINFKAKRELARIRRSTRLEGRILGHTGISEKYDSLVEKNVNRAETATAENRPLRAAYYYMKSASNQRKAERHLRYASFLRRKQGFMEGFNRLPNRFASWLSARTAARRPAPRTA